MSVWHVLTSVTVHGEKIFRLWTKERTGMSIVIAWKGLRAYRYMWEVVFPLCIASFYAQNSGLED